MKAAEQNAIANGGGKKRQTKGKNRTRKRGKRRRRGGGSSAPTRRKSRTIRNKSILRHNPRYTRKSKGRSKCKTCGHIKWYKNKKNTPVYSERQIGGNVDGVANGAENVTVPGGEMNAAATELLLKLGKGAESDAK
jgi:hypothetical protein